MGRQSEDLIPARLLRSASPCCGDSAAGHPDSGAHHPLAEERCNFPIGAVTAAHIEDPALSDSWLTVQ